MKPACATCWVFLLTAAATSALEPPPVQGVPSGAWEEISKLVAPDAQEGDEFAFSVAVSGDTVVVGSHLEDAAALDSGSAYVFERNQGGPNAWGLVKKLIASDAASFDEFGLAVAIDGDVVVVGAHQEDHTSLIDAGAVYVFARNQGGADSWGEVKKLVAADSTAFDELGSAVAIDGDTLVAGAINANAGAGAQIGAAYVFQRDHGGANNWGEVARLDSSDGGDFDLLGHSVSISGDTVVVGADQEDNACPSVTLCNSGAAYVFARDQGGADGWGEVKKLVAADAREAAYFGISVSVSGDTIAVGAYRDDGSADESGSAYVFARNLGGADNWGQLRKLVPADAVAADQFGISVALDRDLLVVGSWLDDDAGFSSGSAYVFARDQGGADSWGEVGKVIASDAGVEDRFGVTVSLSDDLVVVGANRNDDVCPADPECDSGSAYVFDSSIFADGFESGDTAAWTDAVP